MSVYHVPDAGREKEAGHRRMWSDPIKVKHWEEHLDTDTHIFFLNNPGPVAAAHEGDL